MVREQEEDVEPRVVMTGLPWISCHVGCVAKLNKKRQRLVLRVRQCVIHLCDRT